MYDARWVIATLDELDRKEKERSDENIRLRNEAIKVLNARRGNSQ